MNRTGGLAAFFEKEDDEDAQIPQKSVDDQKLTQYTHGTVRKSKREKEKEAAEAKKREEEQEAARAYAEFVNAFDTDAASNKRGGFVKAGGGAEAYLSSSSRSGRTKDDYMLDAESDPTQPKPRGRKAMDSFLEELKRDQADREQRQKRRGGDGYDARGSRDGGDSATTNIFVGNLPPNTTEPILGNFFARVGPVASVKIMWPRTDHTVGPGADITSSRRAKSTGLSGFVSYMKRKDAEVAVHEMDGFDWGGHVLRVGWSKAVPIGPKAAYVVPRSRSRSYSRSRSRSRSRDRRPSRSRDRYHSRSRSRGRSYHSKRNRSYSYSRSRSRSSRYRRRSDSPLRVDSAEETFIRIVARKVKEQGQEFEDVLRMREEGKSKYAFLWDIRCPEHRFYRSLLQSRRGVEGGFDDEGYNSVYSTDSAEESERERGRKGHLGKLARRRFEAMLRALTQRRGDIARCMAFSLEHADAASEVVDIIISSLLLDGTPVPRKVARLYLICDILHNSAATIPNAWKFRQEFQSRLGLVFDHLSTIYHSFPGRITADTFKAQILSVVEVWENWIIFPVETTSDFRARLEGSVEQQEARKEENVESQVPEQTADDSFASRFKAAAFKPATETTIAKTDMMDVDGEPVLEEDVDGEPIPGENLDGEPLDEEDLDGEPLDGEDLDGESLGEPLGEEDLDGEPLDDLDQKSQAKDDFDGELIEHEDVDGEPMALESDEEGEPS